MSEYGPGYRYPGRLNDSPSRYAPDHSVNGEQHAQICQEIREVQQELTRLTTIVERISETADENHTVVLAALERINRALTPRPTDLDAWLPPLCARCRRVLTDSDVARGRCPGCERVL